MARLFIAPQPIRVALVGFALDQQAATYLEDQARLQNWKRRHGSGHVLIYQRERHTEGKQFCHSCQVVGINLRAQNSAIEYCAAAFSAAQALLLKLLSTQQQAHPAGAACLSSQSERACGNAQGFQLMKTFARAATQEHDTSRG
jgi:hypothetical protein